MARTYVMLAILGESDDDRSIFISRLERRFGVTALPDHFNVFRSDPSLANLAQLLEQQMRDIDKKKQELANAPYRILLQPCSPLQLIEFAEPEGCTNLMEAYQALLDRDISDELILIASDLGGDKDKTLLQRAEAHRPGHVFSTSDPEDKTILDEVEAALAQIGGWSAGY